MNDIFEGIPWSKKEVYVNLIAMITLMSFGSFILIIKSWIFLAIFWIFWILYFTVGRYVTCRHCDYLGKACCSWCVGIIGGKLFKRSKKKSFPEAGIWKMLLFDVSFLALATLTPYFTYTIFFLNEGLLLIDWIYLGIYSILGIITLATHSKGCKKCPIDGCPLSGMHKKSKNS